MKQFSLPIRVIEEHIIQNEFKKKGKKFPGSLL